MGSKVYWLCIFDVWVLAASCVRDVEINLDDLDRIVLNASVSPGKDVYVPMSRTWFIMDNVPISIFTGSEKFVSTSMASFKV